MSDGTPDPDKKRYLFDDPRNVDRLLHGFCGVCAVLLYPLPRLVIFRLYLQYNFAFMTSPFKFL